MKKYFFFTLLFSMLLGLIVIVKENTSKTPNSTQGETIAGINILGDSTIIVFSEYSQLIICYVNTSCGVCTEEIQELILFGHDHADYKIAILTEDEIPQINSSIGKNYTISDNLDILQISNEESIKNGFIDYPHFKFYQFGKIKKEQIGKVNLERIVKKIFK